MKAYLHFPRCQRFGVFVDVSSAQVWLRKECLEVAELKRAQVLTIRAENDQEKKYKQKNLEAQNFREECILIAQIMVRKGERQAAASRGS